MKIFIPQPTRAVVSLFRLTISTNMTLTAALAAASRLVTLWERKIFQKKQSEIMERYSNWLHYELSNWRTNLSIHGQRKT